MYTVSELTIDFQLITGSDWVATALFTYPLDRHVEGVSPGHVVDGQCRLDYRIDGSREDAETATASLWDTLNNSLFASFPNQ